MITRFDYLALCYVVIFQCITMEGWVDVMYMVQDAYGFAMPAILFLLLIVFGSLFLLNIALAVVWDAFSSLRDDGGDEAEEEEGENKDMTIAEADSTPKLDTQNTEQVDSQRPLWLNYPCIQKIRDFAESDGFQNVIMTFIITNVVTMCANMYPPPPPWVQVTLVWTNFVFTVVFLIEFAILHLAIGPYEYWTTIVTGFDGIIVVSSVAEMFLPSGGGALMAFRGFRLLRIFKLAKKLTTFRVLLKSMIRTVFSMGHFTVVLVVMMIIFTLMGMQFFATRLRFEEIDGRKRVLSRT
jgi:hypothetical protein